jgi:hypothetical protein
MKIKVATCLLSLVLLPACSTTTQTTAANQTREQRMAAKYASTENAEEPAPVVSGILNSLLVAGARRAPRRGRFVASSELRFAQRSGYSISALSLAIASQSARI